MIGEYQGAHKPVLCRCKQGHEFNLYFSEYLSRGRGCKLCALQRNSGANHWNWQGGGHQDVADALRHSISSWKQECLEQANYRCDICGEQASDLVVHHVNINFSNLMYQALENTHLPLHNFISEYTVEERQALEKELLKLHLPENGVVIRRKYHDEFHQWYGKTNNTLQQYEEFKKKKRQELQ